MSHLTAPANNPVRTAAAITFAIEPLPPLDELEASWTRLDRAGNHSFFLTWSWIGTLLRSLPSPPQTRLLRAKRGNETVALAILTLKRAVRAGVPVMHGWLNATGDPAYDCITIEHNGFASAGVRTSDLWSAFGEWFATGATAANEILVIATDPETAILSKSHFDLEHRDTGFRTPLKGLGDLEGFMASLSRNSRQKLRRSIREYEREGSLSLQVARDSQTALSFLSEMRALHVRSWTRRGKKHAFANPFFETFHRSLVRVGVQSGAVDLLRVSVGDKPIGYLYNFVRNGTVSSYQSGFDDADTRFRPGYVCHAVAIAHYAAAGMAEYDFLAGSNALKHSYGSQTYDLYWMRVRGNKIVVRAESLMRKILTTVRNGS